MDLLALPKIELHCHLDGILTPEMARRIRQIEPSFPIDGDELERVETIYDVDSFFRWMKYFRALDRNLEMYHYVIQAYIEQQQQQRVEYMELFIANGEIPDDPAEAVDAMHVFREWVTQCEAGQMDVVFVVAMGRSNTGEWFQSMESKILALYDAGLIAGVALAGPEIGNPVKPLTRTFARFHDYGIPIEVHAGEWVGAESVWDALEYGYPDRIGHGVSLFQDPHLIDIFLERQIHIEMCPTGNFVTKSVARLEDHPIRLARDLGMNFSINTDDPGPFRCSMLSEYQVAVDVFGFTEADLLRVYEQSKHARFKRRNL